MCILMKITMVFLQIIRPPQFDEDPRGAPQIFRSHQKGDSRFFCTKIPRKPHPDDTIDVGGVRRSSTMPR